MAANVPRYIPGQRVRTPEGRGTVVEDLRDEGLDLVAVRIQDITAHFHPSEIEISRYEKNEEMAELLYAVTSASTVLQRALRTSGDLWDLDMRMDVLDVIGALDQCARRARARLL
jgi:hypothetical protein